MNAGMHALRQYPYVQLGSKVGPVRYVVMQPGSFLLMPPGWLHAVVTREASLGVAGYLRLDSDEQAIEAVPEVSRLQDMRLAHVEWTDDMDA